MLRRLFLAVVLACAAVAAPVQAQEPTPQPAQARALDLFEKSEDAYQKGRFAEAVQYLREAYALTPAPVLLYNLARAYEGLGDLERAAKSYEDFLGAEPNAKDRGAIATRAATLRRQIAEREAARRAAAQPPRPEPRRPSPFPWVVAPLGVAGIGTGAVLSVLSAKRHRDARDEPVQLTATHDQESAKSLATGANVALIAGAAVVAIGVVWGLLDLRAVNASRAAASAESSAAGPFAFALPIP
jgi:tetratricopeptide (TPR) repeat protein